MFLSSCGKVDFGAHPAVVKFVIEIPQEFFFFFLIFLFIGSNY